MATECPDCGAVSEGAKRCRCGYVFPQSVVRTLVERGKPPCTFEQNQEASKIVKAVLVGAISPEEGEKRMAALFGPAA